MERINGCWQAFNVPDCGGLSRHDRLLQKWMSANTTNVEHPRVYIYIFLLDGIAGGFCYIREETCIFLLYPGGKIQGWIGGQIEEFRLNSRLWR